MNYRDLAVKAVSYRFPEPANDPVYDPLSISAKYTMGVGRVFDLLMQDLLENDPQREKLTIVYKTYGQLLQDKRSGEYYGIPLELLELEGELTDTFPKLIKTINQLHSLLEPGK